ncbi:MAG TPA: hypothetical protein VGO03_06465 [Acidimicrobiia bacterium]|jgi:hypothetical protein
MSRSIRGIRHSAAACACALAIAAGACSSSKTAATTTTTPPPSTTTTAALPVPQQILQLHQYLSPQGRGFPLLTYLHTTAAIGAGQDPGKAVCLALTQKLVSQHLDSATVQALVRGLPPIIRNDFVTVPFDRTAALDLCTQGKAIPSILTTGNAGYTGVLRRHLKQYGINI